MSITRSIIYRAEIGTVGPCARSMAMRRWPGMRVNALGVPQLPPHSKNESVRPYRLLGGPVYGSLPNGLESIPGQCSGSAALSTTQASSSPSYYALETRHMIPLGRSCP